MDLRRDHVAGAAFVLAGAIVGALSTGLPFGTLASPGAGMLPIALIGLLIAFGATLFVRAAESPPLATISWGDFRHAVPVIVVAAAAVLTLTTLGFLVVMPLMLFVLIFVVERQPVARAAVFSIVVTAIVYGTFKLLLKTPLPGGILGY